VVAPPGTIVNPVMPASVAARGLTGFRAANALFGALAQIAPDRVFACEAGGDTGISFGGYDAERRPFVFLEFLFGSWGGRPTRDGMDAASSCVVNFSNNPIEIVESEYPLRIERYGYVRDSGGAGTFRGGLALIREYRFLESEGTLQVRADRHKYVPYVHQGGRPGTPARNILDPEGSPRELPSKFRHTIRRDEVFRHVLAGPGGWGDPLRRDPERVAFDVTEDKISAAWARREYGVAVDPATGEVLAEETAQLRAAARRSAER
jgi:N-methylhydantoinase B